MSRDVQSKHPRHIRSLVTQKSACEPKVANGFHGDKPGFLDRFRFPTVVMHAAYPANRYRLLSRVYVT